MFDEAIRTVVDIGLWSMGMVRGYGLCVMSKKGESAIGGVCRREFSISKGDGCADVRLEVGSLLLIVGG